MVAIILVILVFILFFLISQRKETFTNPSKNLVVITSVVHVSDKPLKSNFGGYEVPRNVLTHEERYSQTLETIRSIKAKIPNPYIVLIEGSELTFEEKQGFIKEGCDLLFMEHTELYDIINSPNKSYSEVSMLLMFLKSNEFLKIKNDCVTFSKISGRYFLTDNYDFYRYHVDRVLCQCEKTYRCNTRYYRIPIKQIERYIRILEGALVDPEFKNYRVDIEGYNIFSRFDDPITLFPPKILGVAGYIAPTGKFVEDFRNEQ